LYFLLLYSCLTYKDLPSLIRYPPRSSVTEVKHHYATYRLATILTIPLVFSLLVFWTITKGNVTAVLRHEALPQAYLLLFVIVLILPVRAFSRNGRHRFLSTLRRVSLGGIALPNDGKFGDIILADVLTSYAKVMGDIFVSGCMFFSPKHSSTAQPDRGCGGDLIIPLVIAIPSIIRLRQCLIEYWRMKEGGVWHLANALKYATAFPVIILSAAQRGLRPGDPSEKGLFRLWLFFVFVNSFYSFWWDVVKDWDFTFFTAGAASSTHPYGLRKSLHFRSANLYYVVICLNFLLRCTWSFKLSPHLDHFNDLEGGIFMMELLEIFRRWLWIFLRVETEWIRSSRTGDIPLVDVVKIDED
jgi:hypothetical protein